MDGRNITMDEWREGLLLWRRRLKASNTESRFFNFNTSDMEQNARNIVDFLQISLEENYVCVLEILLRFPQKQRTGPSSDAVPSCHTVKHPVLRTDTSY